MSSKISFVGLLLGCAVAAGCSGANEEATESSSAALRAANGPVTGPRTTPPSHAGTILSTNYVSRFTRGELLTWEACSATEKSSGLCSFRFSELRPSGKTMTFLVTEQTGCAATADYCPNGYAASLRYVTTPGAASGSSWVNETRAFATYKRQVKGVQTWGERSSGRVEARFSGRPDPATVTAYNDAGTLIYRFDNQRSMPYELSGQAFCTPENEAKLAITVAGVAARYGTTIYAGASSLVGWANLQTSVALVSMEWVGLGELLFAAAALNPIVAGAMTVVAVVAVAGAIYYGADLVCTAVYAPPPPHVEPPPGFGEDPAPAESPGGGAAAGPGGGCNAGTLTSTYTEVVDGWTCTTTVEQDCGTVNGNCVCADAQSTQVCIQ